MTDQPYPPDGMAISIDDVINDLAARVTALIIENAYLKAALSQQRAAGNGPVTTPEPAEA